MSLKGRIQLLVLAALSLPLLTLALGALGISAAWQLVTAICGIGVISYLLSRELRRFSADLAAVRRALDETARGEFENTIEVSRAGESQELAAAVLVMRERLAEMGRALAQAVRIDSLNLLGSVLVHEMKNLSFRLRSLSQNIGANYSDPAFQESLTRTLDETTRHMDQMVQRFRAQREIVIVKLRTNLNEVVHSAINNAKRDADGMQVSEQYAELPLVWADPMLLESAIFNIAQNARESMPEGGRLVIRTQLAEGRQNGDRRVLIEIADTGPGMTEEFIRRGLFAPYVTTKARGLGLGMYASQQVIRMHDGEISVRSDPGRGTVFGIYLPIN